MKRVEAILGLRQVLLKRRNALKRALAGNINSLGQAVEKHSNEDPAGCGNGSTEQHTSSCLAEAESRELDRIEQALERMRDGQYGICDGCGISIPMARLNALPYATCCIQCQRETDEAQMGHS